MASLYTEHCSHSAILLACEFVRRRLLFLFFSGDAADTLSVFTLCDGRQDVIKFGLEFVKRNALWILNINPCQAVGSLFCLSPLRAYVP